MKRMTGVSALLMLTGLCGCISVAPHSAAEEKNSSPVARQGPVNGALPPATALANGQAQMPPSSPQWTGPLPPPPAQPGLVDHTAARAAMRTTQMDSITPSSLPQLQRLPSPRPTQLAAQTPEPVAPPPTPIAPPAEMPSATTPKSEMVQQASYAQPESREPSAVNRAEAIGSNRVEPVSGNRMDLSPAPRSVSVPPAPSVKSVPEPRPASVSGKGTPLFRLVNTKRITLNFEVKDTGDSGLSAVDLWFTQDGKEWRKHDAPPQAKAYVVEVDEEGMYGFTLIAKSGTGLSQAPPQAGDPPQVWVIVDLTRPDVQLTEAMPNLKNGSQVVSIKWRASDKNMGRQPITLSYAEKEEGPWKVIATGLDNRGTYNWDVPKGTPTKVLLRVEATDMAGNVGRAQVVRPVLVDNAVPQVRILEVDANSGQ